MQQMNAIAPGGIASMMRGMPQGQPQKPLSPTAGIGNVADRMKAYGPQGLEQKNAVSEDLLNLIAAQKLKSEKEAALRDMQMKAAQQGQPLTVAESLDKELMQMTKQELAPQQMAPQVAGASQQQEQQKQAAMQKLMQGIARAPGAQQMPGMAAGGIVAFQNRGEVPSTDEMLPPRKEGESLEEYRRRVIAHQDRMLALRREREARESAAQMSQSRSGQRFPSLVQRLQEEAPKEDPIEAIMRDTAPTRQPLPQTPPPPEMAAPQERETPQLGRAPVGGPGILGNLKKPVIGPQAGGVAPGLGSQAQGPTPLQGMARPPERSPEQAGPQMPDLEAARRAEEERRRKATELPPDLAAYQKEQLERLRQATQPKEQRWYERLGALAPYLAQQRIDPGRGGIAGGLGRIGVAGAQLGAAERAQQEKAQSAYDAARAAQMKEYQAGNLGAYEAGLNAEKAAREAAFKTRELNIGQAGVDATLAGIAQRARTGSEEIKARREEAAADRENRIKIEEIKAAARNDPESREAAAVARVASVLNRDPQLLKLAERINYDPKAAEEYRRREAEIYLRLAPNLMINRTPTGGASSTRSAADKIISGG